jgi:hypothetical protein
VDTASGVLASAPAQQQAGAKESEALPHLSQEMVAALSQLQWYPMVAGVEAMLKNGLIKIEDLNDEMMEELVDMYISSANGQHQAPGCATPLTTAAGAAGKTTVVSTPCLRHVLLELLTWLAGSMLAVMCMVSRVGTVLGECRCQCHEVRHHTWFAPSACLVT